MKGLGVHITAVLAVLAFFSNAAHGTDIRTVKAIEFKGLKLQSKYDLVRGARLKAVAEGIVIDVDSLEKALAGNAFIESYRVEENRGRLIVSVEEKKPELVVAAVKGGRTYLYELDGNHAVISNNAVHTDRVPFIYMSDGDTGHGLASAHVRRLLSVLDRVRVQNAVIYRELSEIYCNGNSIRVLLRGRKTGFVMKPDVASFIKLKYVAGYCDHAGQYPEEINLTDSAVVVR